MKRSSKTGVMLALVLTMASSFMLKGQGSGAGTPFGLQTAQASVGQVAGRSSPSSTGNAGLSEAAQLSVRRNALIARVRRNLAQATGAPVLIRH